MKEDFSITHRNHMAKSAEAARHINKLLEEYSSKLNILIREYENKQSRLILIPFVIIIIVLAVMGLLIAQSPTNIAGSLKQEPSSAFTATVFISLVMVGYIGFMIAFSIWRSIESMRLVIKTSIKHVEILIRSASQFQEHADTDYSSRIELDLRLAEAEELVKYASEAIESLDPLSRLGILVTRLFPIPRF